MAEAFFTGPQVALDAWQGHSSSRGDNTHTPLGTQQHLAASTLVPNRHLGEPQQNERYFNPSPGGSEWSHFQTTHRGTPAGPPADPPVVQWPAATPRPWSSPTNPESPEDRGQMMEIRYFPQTAVIQPMIRPPPARPPYLTVSPSDVAQISRFLVHPFEQYTHLEDLRSEIGAMTTEVYSSLQAGLTLMARKQVQKVRSLAYKRRHRMNLKRMREECERLAQQLNHARQTAILFQRKVGQTQVAYDQALQDIAQLQQANITLLNFCQSRLQQQTTAVNGLEDTLQRGVGGTSLPQQEPQDPRAREQ